MKTGIGIAMEEAEIERKEGILRVMNEPGMTWKVRRALLREKFKVPEDLIKQLVPEDSAADY